MSPTHTSKSRGRYRYYVSQALLQHRPKDAGSLPRVPAEAAERYIRHTLSRLAGDPTESQNAIQGSVERIELSKSRMTLTMRNPIRISQSLRNELRATVEKHRSAAIIKVPFALAIRGGQKGVVAGDVSDELSERSTQALVKAIARGWRWRRMFESGEVGSIPELAKKENLNASYLKKVLRLSFLPPEAISRLLQSPTPSRILLDGLLGSDVSLNWT